MRQEEMNLDEAAAILNNHSHRGWTNWQPGQYGVHANLHLAILEDVTSLNRFEAIAIATKYVMDEKNIVLEGLL